MRSVIGPISTSSKADKRVDEMTFIDHLIGHIASVAWPAAVVAIVLILHRPLSRVIEALRIRSLTYKGATFNFAEAVERVEAEADRADLPQAEPSSMLQPEQAELEAPAPTLGSADAEIEALARLSPPAAVQRAWLEVERATYAAVERAGFPSGARNRNVSWAIGILTQQGLLDGTTVHIIQDLRHLRNEVAHAVPGPVVPVTYDAALEYAQQVRRVVRVLNSIHKLPPNVVHPHQ